ncbi:c-type cytochrome [Sulfurospirillum deleyianum]|uniref:C-type cytochrome, putative n=1 Tax=Sulfurospirillum deleyianum (strain ATCC 51133 / DSM 6946 / 5175) TaxID=525898 RepID=D1B3T3_SULD5|nr:c-type cytochrome [Sulfurospirillum deleyianum]ACZ12753.1 C-type cytochrome, putative [Sulfurospirillum deleyianum DSM 6946]
MKRFFGLIFITTTLSASNLGETLFQGNCVTCHAIQKANSAPSIQAIQTRYKEKFPTKEDFVSFMAQWILKPNAKTALMPEAIAQYELMPILGYDKESLEEIARYLYDATWQP